MVQRLARRRGQEGFTLVELLAVIAVLGILAAVVVFAVQSVQGEGERVAVAIDERILRTAEEAFCAQADPPRYASEDELVAAGLLSSRPEIHTVTATGDPGDEGSCGTELGATHYRIGCRDGSPMPDCGTPRSGPPTTGPAPCAPTSDLTWAQLASPVADNLRGVSFVTDQQGWALAHNGAIFRTTDGGASWSLQHNAGAFLNAIEFVSATRGWVAGTNGILYTTNGGADWTPAETVDGDGSPLSASFWSLSFSKPAGVKGFAGALNGIFVSDDGGRRWTRRLATNVPNAIRTVAATSSASSGHAVDGNNGQIYGTRDGGQTWIVERPGFAFPLPPLTPPILSMAFPTEQSGHGAGRDGTLVRTSNGGTLWEDGTSCTDQTLHGLAFANATRALAVGVGGTVIYTRDGGSSWHPQSNVPVSITLTAVSFPSPTTAYAVGDGGAILKGTVR